MQQYVREAMPDKHALLFKTKLEYELLVQALYLLQQTMNLPHE